MGIVIVGMYYRHALLEPPLVVVEYRTKACIHSLTHSLTQSCTHSYSSFTHFHSHYSFTHSLIYLHYVYPGTHSSTLHSPSQQFTSTRTSTVASPACRPSCFNFTGPHRSIGSASPQQAVKLCLINRVRYISPSEPTPPSRLASPPFLSPWLHPPSPG